MNKKMKYFLPAVLSLAAGAVFLKAFIRKMKKSGDWDVKCPVCGHRHKACWCCSRCGHMHFCESKEDKEKEKD